MQEKQDIKGFLKSRGVARERIAADSVTDKHSAQLDNKNMVHHAAASPLGRYEASSFHLCPQEAIWKSSEENGPGVGGVGGLRGCP